MLDHVNVPFDGPQILAFAVPAQQLAALREASQAAYERGDGAPLRKTWESNLPAYSEQRRRVRWRVPRSTLLDALDGLRGAVELVMSTPLAKVRRRLDIQRMPLPDPEQLERLRTQLGRWKQRLADVSHVDLDPPRWIRFATGLRYMLRAWGMPRLSLYWGVWAGDLEALDAGPETLDPRGSDACGDVAAPGSIERSRVKRFFREVDGEGTITLTRDDQFENLMWDYAELADGETLPVAMARDDVYEAMSLRAQLELLVGPCVLSRGTGPFCPPPKCAKQFIDPDWNLLDLYRVGTTTDLAWQPPALWYIEPRDLEAALDELRTTKPVSKSAATTVPWSRSWGRAHADWLSWRDARTHWWPRCRDRFATLLDESRRAGQAVLLVRYLPEDQGTLHSPVSDDLGQRVVVG